jgi:predicted permease
VLRILPTRFRSKYGDEMEELYEEALERAARRGVLAWCYAAARAVIDVVAYRVRMRRTSSALVRGPPLTSTDMIESTLLDLRLAARSLVKAPGFALVAVVLLALGIGANTSIFTVINAVILRAPPHVERPDELVSIYTSDFSGPQFGASSYPDYVDFRDQTPAITDAVAFQPRTASVPGADGVAEAVVAEAVTGNYFDMLGTQLALGRGFSAEEGDYASGASVVVLSHGYWQRRFAGRPDIIGETFRASGQTVTVVGVAPEGFTGMLPLVTPDLWMPVSTQALIEGADNFESRGSRGTLIVARLAEGSTVELAQSQLTALAGRLHQEYADRWTDLNGEIRRVTVVDGVRQLPIVTGAVNTFAVLLLAVVGIVLLIACANVANLSLARASRRGRELAMKVVLGAGRRRIVRQLLAESAIVGAIGGLAGLALAIWLVGLAEGLALLTGVSVTLDLAVDRNVLLFSAFVTILTVFAVGLLPAFKASRPDLVSTLKRGSGERSGPSRWYEARYLLVMSQVSASVVLLVGAGLFLKSLRTAVEVDPGFRVEGVAMLTMDLMDMIREGYSPEEAVAFIDDLQARMAGLPGVEATSIADALPMTAGALQRTSVRIPGYERAEGEDMEFQYHSVGADFMAALGMEVLLGREFTDADTEDSPPVVMVNETFAARFWPGESPLGKVVYSRGRDMEVIGLVRDALYRSLSDQDRPAFFLPIRQNLAERVTLLARTSSADAADLLPMMRDEVRTIDARLPIITLQTMEDAIAFTLLPQRVASGLLSVTGGLGLLLAAVGLYGVLSFLVAQRTREVGVRMALGAEAGQVVRMVVRRGLALAAVGALIGIGMAALVTRFLQSLLFGVSAFDPVVFALMTTATLAIAGLASWIPARRASGVDPMVALRHE